MRSLRVLAAVTALFGYVLVALSPIVRITGSGMGCGDDWPLCNGRLIPPLDRLDVMIEWGHRMAVVGLTVLVVALLAVAWGQRRQPGVSGRGGVLRPAVWAAVLLVLQSLLGAITVWLELPPAVVVIHLGNAMALLAVLCVAAWRAHGAVAGPAAANRPSSRAWRSALVAAGLGGVALLLGGLTANLHAGMACTGFPLCSGQWWPAAGAGGLAHIHWTHRLVAYALALHLIGMVVSLRRRGEPRAVQVATWLAVGVLAAHVGVAVWMIGQALPLSLRASHAALGALVWVCLVYVGWHARPAAVPTA
ncbi:MAG: COX15/CtaA family protein [Gemmatimonadota bacterium]|nr:COX15/CtaA family protein [Gemmatimonadota bacterium]